MVAEGRPPLPTRQVTEGASVAVERDGGAHRALEALVRQRFPRAPGVDGKEDAALDVLATARPRMRSARNLM